MSYGIGAVLLQKQESEEWKPVAYSSRSLTSTEQKYAQIEKEALSITWACERFINYLLGMDFEIETVHKPLISLLGEKFINELPLHIQRFRMRLMKFSYRISGKNLIIADALSQAPSLHVSSADYELKTEVDAYVNAIISSLPATDTKLEEIKSSQQNDLICKQLTQFCLNGWPSSSKLSVEVKCYMPVASELSIHEGLLMRNNRIVIPKPLQAETLIAIHKGHQGITKCRECAEHSVWWPGLSKEV